MNDVDLSKPFKVQFVGEPAVDYGGPSREFFSLINQHMHRSMLCGTTFRHNVVSLQKEEFMKCGQLAAKGLLQGSAGPKCFGKTVTDYILYGNVQCLNPTLEEVSPGELKDSLERLEGIQDAEELKSEASFNSDFRFSHGYMKPLVTIENKNEFIKAIALHAIIYSSVSELNQFIDGLKTYGILDLVRSNPEQLRAVFQYGKATLTADLLDDIFHPSFSPEGSNKRVKEERIVFNFNQMLENVEKGKVVEELGETELTISLSHILMFATGASEIPAIGLIPRPSIRFNHNTSEERKLSVSACANILTLPVSEKMASLESFQEEFMFCMLNSPGFGNV
jgi:hypothetical protein